jgi:hypothetical protein
MRALISVLSVVTLAVCAVILADDFNRAGLFGSGGTTSKRSVFGLEIGMPGAEVSRRLARQGLARGAPGVPGECLGRSFAAAGETLILWDDNSWRRGVLCIGLKHDAVSSIAWSYGGWPL